MQKHYVMLIDLQACVGCNTCAVACKQENNLPEKVWWCQIITVGANGSSASNHGNTNTGNGWPVEVYRQDLLPLACQHCVEAPCIEVCPTSATYRSEGGIVMQDPNLCIGCRYCMMVCPFTGVRVFANEGLTYKLSFPTGSNPVSHQAKTVEKCTFCAHRVAAGQEPACVLACPTDARIFGDLNDPDSEVAHLLRTRPHFQLLREKGTRPSVYFLS